MDSSWINMANKGKTWKTFKNRPVSQNESTIASGVFILHLRTQLFFIKKTKGKLMSQYDSYSFRKWLYTHCQIISRGEGMTSLHLMTNTEKTCVTSLLVSCFPQQHWQIYPRSWHWVISPVSALHIRKLCRTQVTLNPYMFQISNSAAYCSPSSIPPHWDQLLRLLVYSFCPQIDLTRYHFPVLNASAPCSTSVCSFNLFTSICRKGYTLPKSGHTFLSFCASIQPYQDPPDRSLFSWERTTSNPSWAASEIPRAASSWQC